MVAAVQQENDVTNIRETETNLYFSDVMTQEVREHSTRVGWYAYLLARQYQLDEQHSQAIMRGGLFHDIGKSKVPKEITDKPTKLTEYELSSMKCHCMDGVAIAKRAQVISQDNPDGELYESIIAGHHENYDGSGYPNGLKGDEIRIEANLVALADIFDALSSERVYKKAWEEEKVVDYINSMSGKVFRPDLVEAFNKIRHAFIALRRYFNENGTPTEDPFHQPAMIGRLLVHENIFVPFTLPNMECIFEEPNYCMH